MLSLVAFYVTNLWYYFYVIMMLFCGEFVIVPVRTYAEKQLYRSCLSSRKLAIEIVRNFASLNGNQWRN